jgi:hypothetical protein
MSALCAPGRRGSRPHAGEAVAAGASALAALSESAPPDAALGATFLCGQGRDALLKRFLDACDGDVAAAARVRACACASPR